MRTLVIFFMLIMIFSATGCFESSDISKSRDESSIINESEGESLTINESKGIYDNANRLYDDYKWKLDLVSEIQTRTDALGTDATKEMYVEWKRRDNEAIDAGERLATYITEHRDILNQYWTSDILVLIAKNKVTFERDNQAHEQIINSFENPTKKFLWELIFYGSEGGKDLGTITFQNTGKNLSNVKFTFLLTEYDGDFYSSESVLIGDVAKGKIVTKKVSIPSRYWGGETWSIMDLSIYVNNTIEEKWVLRDGEWKEQQK